MCIDVTMLVNILYAQRGLFCSTRESRSSTHARQCKSVTRSSTHAREDTRVPLRRRAWMEGGGDQRQRTLLRWPMDEEREDRRDLIIFTQCHLLREAYLCALCVYLVYVLVCLCGVSVCCPLLFSVAARALSVKRGHVGK